MFIIIVIGVPVWTGRKMFTRYRHSSRLKRNIAIAGGVIAAVSVELNHFYLFCMVLIEVIDKYPIFLLNNTVS